MISLTFLVLALCGTEDDTVPLPPEDFSARLLVVDESGEVVAGARIELTDATVYTDDSGNATLPPLQGPEVALVSARGYLTEPVPLGWQSASDPVRITLLQETGRIVLHFGGDVMLGRRYREPTSGDPLLPDDDIAGGARRVVSRLARPFAAADFRSLNLETVISERNRGEAYPGKRFLLISHPQTTAALEELQVDMVGLANNHARDWLDAGVDDTLEALKAADIPCLGAGLTRPQAEAPLVVEVKGITIGMLAYTTVTGSFVNDSYPDGDKARPEDLAEDEAWMYEERTWGFRNDEYSVPQQQYRIGAVWSLFQEAEEGLSETTRAEAWASMSETFPELQDWVARRGHGGAAMWRTARAVAQIAALAAEVDLTVVQLHSGFQFQTAASATIYDAARAAIDAGADLVIAHHPHVLQGMDFYKDRLIVYSLGNFVFDQDFSSTFASGFIRAVWEDNSLIQARFIPLELAGYRPLPIADRAAERTLRRVWERSVLPAVSARDKASRGVYPFFTLKDMHTKPVHMVFEHNTARLVDEAIKQEVSFKVRRDRVIPLDPMHLTPARLGLQPGESPDILVGRDIFGWGRYEDEVADGRPDRGETHWLLDHQDEQVIVGRAADGRGFLRLFRDEKNSSQITTRPVARIPLSRHRLYQAVDGSLPEPLDPRASYCMRMDALCRGSCEVYVRLDIYKFDDTNPTEDPQSELLRREEIPVDVNTSSWKNYEISFDPEELTGSTEANMVMFYLMLAPPEQGESSLEVDELQVIEWRSASQMPDIYGAFTHLKNNGETRTISYQALSARPR